MHELETKLDMLIPFEQSVAALKLQEKWAALEPFTTSLRAKCREVAVILFLMCVGQLFLHPDQWTNIGKQIAEAYKLADSLKLKKEAIPLVVRDAMEVMKKKKPDTPLDAPSQGGEDASQAGSRRSVSDAPSPKGSRGGARGRGRGGRKGAAPKAPAVRQTGKKKL